MISKVEVQGFPTRRRTSATEQYKYFSERSTKKCLTNYEPQFIILEIHVLRVPGPVSFSSVRISIPKIDKRHTAPLRSPPALPGWI